MFDIKYNGFRPNAYNCMLATIPKVIASEIREDRFTIPYRDGDLLGKSYRGNAHVTFTIHMKYDESTLQPGLLSQKEMIKIWLSQKSRLYIYEDGAHPIDREYYEVLKTTFPNEWYKTKDYWRLEVDMEVYPFRFFQESEPINIGTSSTTVTNYGDLCKPTYQINSNVAGNLVVGGYSFALTARPANTSIVIDSRRKIAYNPSTHDNYSIYVNGDYEKLWIPFTSYEGVDIVAPASGTVYLNEGVII